jgi:Family of unknown function (DUF6454)
MAVENVSRRELFAFLAGASLLRAQSGELPDLRTPSKILALQGTTAHVQGIDTDGQLLWVSSVDRPSRKGFLAEYSLADGRLLRRVEVQDGDRFHAGGLAADADSLWIPVAEYRATSTALIQRRSKRTLAVESQFAVDDHIGCVAVTPQQIIGGNWDSRDFYFWDHSGKLLDKRPSNTGNSYQDLKFASGRLIASGTLAGHKGAVDSLELPSLKLNRRLTTGDTDTGVPFTREAMTLHGNQLWFLPEDGASRLMMFDLPAGFR